MFENLKKIHFIGVGGIGVSAIAIFFLARGKKISGSDAVSSEIVSELAGLGAKIFLGHGENNLEEDTELVIYSSAVPSDNPEILKAKSLRISIKSYPEILGEIMSYFSESVAVSGTNGKTTTTSLIGLILERAGLDPVVIVGSKVKEWGGNARLGKTEKYFVAEACEYKRGMLNLNPKYIVLTNIEEDHLDYFKDLEDIKSAFKEYVSQLAHGGALIYNEDDPASREATEAYPPSGGDGKISYSARNQKADLAAANIKQEDGKQKFNLVWRGKDLGVFEICIPGIFNIYNCLAAAAIALHFDIKTETIRKVFAEFRGVWRRFEKVGVLGSAVVISDYAHHPTAIRETIRGAKKFFPGKKILVVFEPHQKDRTIKLFDDFVKSFDEADEVIISEIYSVEGRNDSEREISSLDLVRAIKNKYTIPPVSYSPNLAETKKMILQKAKNFDIILIMGAGDIYKVVNDLAVK